VSAGAVNELRIAGPPRCELCRREISLYRPNCSIGRPDCQYQCQSSLEALTILQNDEPEEEQRHELEMLPKPVYHRRCGLHVRTRRLKEHKRDD
jgi:hypothetical protein